MRYWAVADSNVLSRGSLGPAQILARQRVPLPVSGRGEPALNQRTGSRRTYVMNGFGAANASIWSGPPVGTGAGKGAEIGAAQGASLGTTIMPGIGTAIGAVIGAIGGAIAGAIGKQDPEIQNFNQAIAVWQQNPSAVTALANKYLVLAGFFDLTNSQAGKIRIYRKYGRMGEEAFTRDFANLIYQAAQSGQITASDTPASVYQKIILPWEDSWGFGAEPPNPHSDFMDRLLMGMILDYASGYGPGHWYSRSGPLPASFSSIPPFSFPQTQAAPATASATPSPVATTTAIASTVSSAPPALNSAVSYALDAATGKMVSLPAGAVYSGLTATGAWMITYTGANAGTYTVQNGVLTPVPGATAAVAATPPAGYTLTPQQASINGVVYPLYSDSAGNLYVWLAGQMIPYGTAATAASSVPTVSSGGGGGGGGYYPGYSQTSTETPAPPTATVTATADSSSTLMMILGGGALLYLLLKR